MNEEPYLYSEHVSERTPLSPTHKATRVWTALAGQHGRVSLALLLPVHPEASLCRIDAPWKLEGNVCKPDRIWKISRTDVLNHRSSFLPFSGFRIYSDWIVYQRRWIETSFLNMHTVCCRKNMVCPFRAASSWHSTFLQSVCVRSVKIVLCVDVN